MFQKKLRSDGNGNNDVNMTPLIDVSLVLVVILLLATPLAFQSSIGLRNASASGKYAERIDEGTRVELRLFSEDSLAVNRRMIARSELASALPPLLARNSERLVIVTCAGHVSHGTFVSVVDEAKLHGAMEIAMVGR